MERDASLCFHALMAGSNESEAFLHDLRVLVSSIQMNADDVLGSPDVLDGGAFTLRDQIELLAEVLRVASYVEAEGGDTPARPIDLRAIAFLARSRRPATFLGEMTMPVRVRVDPVAAVELVELAAYWTAGDSGRITMHARSNPACLVLEAVGPVPAQGSDQREIEQAVESLAGSCRVELQLKSEPRAAVLLFETEQYAS